MKQSTYEILEKLVSFPTVSDGPNDDMIGYVSEYLRALDIAPVLLPDPTGKKIALLATVGPIGPGGVVLSGHGDVVTADGQEWTADPFHVVRQCDRLVGRGVADMKGFLAVSLAMVPDMLAAGLEKPIHIMISYDEETTCEGVVPLIDYATNNLPPIQAVLIGEPTEMKVLNAHKGAYGCVVNVTGRNAHSGLIEDGVSAISIASRLVTWIDDQVRMNAERAVSGPFNPNYTTCHVGRISGGTAVNVLAGGCSFEWDMRFLPADNPLAFAEMFDLEAERLVSEARRIAPECRVERKETFLEPALSPEPGGFAETLAFRLTGTTTPTTMCASSEAVYFRKAGFSTVLVGPGRLAQVHTPDEFVAIDQLEQCEAFVERLILEQQAA